MPSAKVGNSSVGRSWPMPGIEQQLRAGHGVRGRAAAGHVHEPVGQAVDDERRRGHLVQCRERSGWARIASICRITPLVLMPRSKVSPARSRVSSGGVG